MARCRTLIALALVLSLTLITAGCRVDGTAAPDPVAAAARTTSPGTIEGHSTSPVPTDSTGPTTNGTSTATVPTITMANDGFAVSVMVTTIWSRALVATGTKVGIRTIGATADQVAALRTGQIDLAQQYNSGLLRFLDSKAVAVGQSAVDSAIAARLPAGLSVLTSSPATEDVQLAVSAATAAKYRLHSISDLASHLAELTLLLPDDGFAKSFANGLTNSYGLTFATTEITDFAGAKTIAAIKSKAAVGLMDASQYQIDDNSFVVLTDPQHLFLTENFIPLIGGSKITPAMKTTLNAVSRKLSVAALRSLRKRVATGQGSYPDVADAWLASVGLK